MNRSSCSQLRWSRKRGESPAFASCLTEQRFFLPPTSEVRPPDCLVIRVNTVWVTSQSPTYKPRWPGLSTSILPACWGLVLSVLQPLRHPSPLGPSLQHHGHQQDAAPRRPLLAAGGFRALRRAERGAIPGVRSHQDARGGAGESGLFLKI